MLGKYTTTIWNILCIASIILSVKLISPFILNQERAISQKEEVFVIKQIGTKRTLWKRGEMACTTTINENKSTSKLSENNEHFTDDWMSINWSKQP